MPRSSGGPRDVLRKGVEVGSRCRVDTTGKRRSFDEGSSPKSLPRGSSPRPLSTTSPFPSTPPTSLTLRGWTSFTPTGQDGGVWTVKTMTPTLVLLLSVEGPRVLRLTGRKR